MYNVSCKLLQNAERINRRYIKMSCVVAQDHKVKMIFLNLNNCKSAVMQITLTVFSNSPK